jgi:hypothetical protein
MQDCIHVEKHVALSLAHLGSRNSLMSCEEPFGILDSRSTIIVRELCHAMKVHLMPLVIPKLTSSRIAKISVDFESLHGISLILDTIDGSHISIIALKVNPKSYYSCKGFYSTLIQGFVNAKCMF